MKDVREVTINSLQLTADKLFGEKVEVKLEIPQDPSHGDYSSNIALALSKKLGRNPREIAEEIKNILNTEYGKLNTLDKVETAGPGFLNFFLSKTALEANLASILERKEDYGKSDHAKGFKVMVEFTDPNPLKEFHIGHLYSNTVGESLSRLFEASGADVWRVCYQGDVGLHVAKALFGILKKLELENVTLEDLAKESLDARAKFLGEAYAFGAKEFEEHKDEITKLNKSIYEKDSEVYAFYETVKSWSLEYFETIYKRLGTKFDKYYFESDAGKRGIEIVRQNVPGIFEEEGRAVIFPKEKSGLHTRVFINSLGLPTYEAKELGLAPQKYEDFPYDLSVIVTGNEINEYFKVLLKALSLIRPDLAEKTKHISHGMVRLPSGKMSSRTGDVITGEFMLEEVKKNLKNSHPEMQDNVSEDLTVGALKYAFLKPHLGSDIIFNIEESINLHGNSGPYIQYTHARTQSVLKKRYSGPASTAKRGELDPESHGILKQVQDDKLEKEEFDLLRILVHFPEVVSEATEKFAPNLVENYLFDLSQKFNLFYEKHKVIGSEHEAFRLALTSAVGQVLKNGLSLLGIHASQKI